MTSAKAVINLCGGSHTSRPYSSQRRRKSRADKRIKLLVGNYFLKPYSVQIQYKSRETIHQFHHMAGIMYRIHMQHRQTVFRTHFVVIQVCSKLIS